MMLAYLDNLVFWDWLIVATALLIIEVFGARGYALWMSACALVVGLVCFALPALHWVAQMLLFVALALLVVWAWRRHQRQQTSTR